MRMTLLIRKLYVILAVDLALSYTATTLLFITVVGLYAYPSCLRAFELMK